MIELFHNIFNHLPLVLLLLCILDQSSLQATWLNCQLKFYHLIQFDEFVNLWLIDEFFHSMFYLIVSSSILCWNEDIPIEMNDTITSEFVKHCDFFLKFSHFFSCSMINTTTELFKVIEISNSTDSLFFNVTTFVIIIEIKHFSIWNNLSFQ